MAKKSKAAPIFWACVTAGFEFFIVLAMIVCGIFTDIQVGVLIFAAVPLAVGVFVIYFLVQRIREIDEEAKHESEYDKY